MRDSYRRPIVEQRSPAYWAILWLSVFIVFVGFIFAMCEIGGSGPDKDLQYARECLAAHGSYTIHEHEELTDRSCTLR